MVYDALLDLWDYDIQQLMIVGDGVGIIIPVPSRLMMRHTMITMLSSPILLPESPCLFVRWSAQKYRIWFQH